MAVHYYDEDNIDIRSPMNCHAVVNHVVELTEEEKQEARQDAIQRLQNEAYTKMKQPKKKATQTVTDNSLTLFDL